MPKGFLRRQRQQLSLLDQTSDLHVWVHHRLGDQRRPLAGFCGRAKFRSHVGNGFFFHRLSGRSWLSRLHGHRGANGSAVRHSDFLRGETDEGPRGDSTLVHEGDRAYPRVQETVAYRHGGIDSSPKSVDVENNGRGAFVRGLLQHPLNKRRQPKINGALNGGDVYDRRWLLRERTTLDSDRREQRGSEDQG